MNRPRTLSFLQSNLNYCLLFLLLCLGCRHQATAQPDIKMHRVQDTTTRDASGWYKATSTEGHFTVMLPVPFNDFTITSKDSAGGVLRMFVIGTKTEEGIKFTVTEAPYMKKGMDPDLNGIIHEFEGDGNRITAVSRESWQGHPAISFRLSGRSSGACIRYLKTTQRLVTMIIEYPNAYEELATSCEDRMFRSLELTEE